MSFIISKILNEAKDLTAYKKLIRVFGEYSDKFPATGVSKMFNQLVSVGLKAMPKDKVALVILRDLATQGNASLCVQSILNKKFSDLSFAVKPVYIGEYGKKMTAFWDKGGSVYDGVKLLLNLEGEVKGYWSDESGNKVKLIDKSEL